MDFGNNDNLNLDRLNEVVSESLYTFASRISKVSGINFSIQGQGELKRMIDRDRYTLKGNAKVSGLENSLDATIVGFAPGDGTGSPTKYEPRQKTGAAEIFIPIGTLFNDQFIPQLTHLEEIGKKGKIIQTLGSNSSWYDMLIQNVQEENIAIKFETFPFDFTYVKGQFGDPHAIRFDKWSADNVSTEFKNWIQFGAFIPFNEYTNQVVDLHVFCQNQTPWIFHYEGGRQNTV